MRFFLPFCLLSILTCFNFSEVFGQTAPIADNDSVSIINKSTSNEVVYLEVDFLTNDSYDDIDQLDISILRQTDQYGKMYLIENNSLMIFYPYEDSFGIDTVHYQICDQNNQCSKAYVVVEVLDPNQVELEIPTSFTPNSDGFNDKFFIKGIDQYPNNEFIVFSRWGTKVYEKKNYSNEEAWGGGYNKAGVKLGPGDKLPKGTYFFKLVIKDKEYVKSGYIVIKY
ncbi:gliding motility-associated C-terminal domain-containing protein [Labilibaculum sp.]|uniref:gliding motility-associated C-terminal domain-containing protein n=1 Tax=Labilibaculum sp. TaxID=2060723 RepID=UPI003563EB29